MVLNRFGTVLFHFLRCFSTQEFTWWNFKITCRQHAHLTDEKRHLSIFWTEIQRRGGVKCKSYWLCGLGGWVTGFVSALFGKTGVMACTLAVESVVAKHLHEQLIYLKHRNDAQAYLAVNSIVDGL